MLISRTVVGLVCVFWNCQGSDWFCSCLGSVTTAAILGVLYTVASTFQPLPQDIYRYGTNPFYITL